MSDKYRPCCKIVTVESDREPNFTPLETSTATAFKLNSTLVTAFGSECDQHNAHASPLIYASGDDSQRCEEARHFMID